MNLVFFGTPEFAVPTLNALHLSSHSVLAVVTSPDRKSGRGLNVQPSSVKSHAEMISLPILQPDNLYDDNFISTLKQFNPDIYVVAAYKILPEVILNIPKDGAVNLHASLLPKYRGAAPIYHAVLNGEYQTGITTFLLKQKVDTGDILLQKSLLIDDNITSGELLVELSHIGADIMVKTLDRISDKTIVPKKQNSKLATLAPKISIVDCKIDWTLSALKIHNKIRAFSPSPGAFTYYNNKRIKLFGSKVLNNKVGRILQPGRINYNKPFLQIGTGSKEIIVINNIQIEGKKRLPVTQFILGYSEITGEKFE